MLTAPVWWLPYGGTLASSCEAAAEACEATLTIANTALHAAPDSALYGERVCPETYSPCIRLTIHSTATLFLAAFAESSARPPPSPSPNKARSGLGHHDRVLCPLMVDTCAGSALGVHHMPPTLSSPSPSSLPQSASFALCNRRAASRSSSWPQRAWKASAASLAAQTTCLSSPGALPFSVGTPSPSQDHMLS